MTSYCSIYLVVWEQRVLLRRGVSTSCVGVVQEGEAADVEETSMSYNEDIMP